MLVTAGRPVTFVTAESTDFALHVQECGSWRVVFSSISSAISQTSVRTVEARPPFLRLFPHATCDGTPQNFASRKGGTKLYVTINMCLRIEQATHTFSETIVDECVWVCYEF
jgi:hypothetical protein